jgi:hypothetical protein
MTKKLIKMEKRVNHRGYRDGLVSKKFIFFSAYAVVKKYFLIPVCPG